MRKNHAFLFTAFVMLLVLQVIMVAKSGIQIGSLITAFMSYNGHILFSFDAFIKNWDTYIPMTISVFSNGAGVLLSILPMLCAFAFLIVAFFKKKFIIGVYASVVLAFIILTSAFSLSTLSVLVERTLGGRTRYMIFLFSDAFKMSIDIEVVVRLLINLIVYLATPLLQISLHWIPFVIFLLLCLSLITIASKDPYATKGGKRK